MALRKSYIVLFALLFSVACTSSDPSDDNGLEDDQPTQDTRDDDDDKPPMEDTEDPDYEDPDDDENPPTAEDTTEPPEETNDDETRPDDTSSEDDFDPDEDTVKSCDDIPAESCFANTDCSDSKVCLDVGDEASVRCCVDGQRGDKEAGDQCDDSAEKTACQSGICLSGSQPSTARTLCSKPCESANDCPFTMKECKALPGAQDSQKWCWPSELQASSCEEINSSVCLYNGECPKSKRCENLPGDTNSACCVPGQRGDRESGESCDGDDGNLKCQSGACIPYESGDLCTKTCQDASDCPDNMNTCETRPFFGETKWCLASEND